MYANRLICGVKVPCVALLIVCVMFIFAYGYYRRQTGTLDFLEKKIVDSPSFPGFDGWAVTHTLFFGFLGFLYPGHHVQALVASVAWEGFESVLGANKITMSGVRLQLIGATDADGRPIDPDDEGEGGNAWWYGRSSDVLFNLTGYIVGSALGMRLWPPKKGDNVFIP